MLVVAVGFACVLAFTLALPFLEKKSFSLLVWLRDRLRGKA